MDQSPNSRELLAKPLIAGNFRVGKRYATTRSLGTDDWLLIYTVGGAGRFHFEHGEMMASPGTFVMIRPQTPHNYCTASEPGTWVLLWTHFQPRPHWDALLTWPEIASGLMRLDVVDPDLAVRVEGLFRRVVEHSSSGRPKAAQFALAALEELLLWCDTVNPLEPHSRLDPRVSQAVEHICANLTGDLSIESLAQLACSSVSRFSHLFQQQMGIAPQKFIEGKRIERARALLAATQRSIADIAADIGYENPFYFSLRFKKATGMSPSEYRSRPGGEDARMPKT